MNNKVKWTDHPLYASGTWVVTHGVFRTFWPSRGRSLSFPIASMIPSMQQTTCSSPSRINMIDGHGFWSLASIRENIFHLNLIRTVIVDCLQLRDNKKKEKERGNRWGKFMGRGKLNSSAKYLNLILPDGYKYKSPNGAFGIQMSRREV